MSIQPSFSEFEQRYRAGDAQLVHRRIVSDLDTPVSAFLKIAGNQKNAFLLESVTGGDQLGRYSIIGLKPDLIWRANGDKVEINRHALYGETKFEPIDGAPLDRLKDLLAESAVSHIDENLPPMAAGVFGYFGYDMVRQMEKLAPKKASGVQTHDSIFIRPTIIAVFDNVCQEISFYTPVRPAKDVNARAAYARASERLTGVIENLQGAALPAESFSQTPFEFDLRPNTSEAEYKSMIAKAKDYIEAGDIFQVVLSQRFSTPFTASPFALYRELRRSNPSPFLFYFNLDDCSIIGSSPEILVRVRDNQVTIRPIAGTRPRGANEAEDLALEKDLLADEKERAEHLMLLDLGRNDVGRSARFGTVKVTDEFIIERYSHVMHIVSNVVGELADGVHPVDAVSAGFPAGTVSGAPKVRAMEIIDELEKDCRGIYGGTIGYFSADGNVDTCIALRTGVIKDGVLHVQAGAGIVADSNPDAEQKECENKARALLAAAEHALARDGN